MPGKVISRTPATTLETIGQKIRARRESLGLTQPQLAESLGHGQPWLQKIESGAKQIQVSDLIAVAKMLGVRVEKLLP